MDERELANRVVDVVDEAAFRRGLERVSQVALAIGGRHHYDLDQLSSVFEQVSRGTVADGARLKIEILSVRHHCRSCGHNFEGSGEDQPCPACRHPNTELVNGEELRVTAIQFDEPDAA